MYCASKHSYFGQMKCWSNSQITKIYIYKAEYGGEKNLSASDSQKRTLLVQIMDLSTSEKKIISETVLDMKQPSLCNYSEKAMAHNAHNIIPRIRVGCVVYFNTVLTLRLLMSYIYIYIYIYIYGAPILDVSRSHTTTQHSR